MNLNFEKVLIEEQPDPFACEGPGGWAVYVTESEGLGAFYCDMPFVHWDYKEIACKKEDYHEYQSPCMYHENNWYYLYVSCKEMNADDIKTVQENLGHATASFTLDAYGHVTDQMKRDSADRMEKFIYSVHQ